MNILSKTLTTSLILVTALLTGCASQSASEQSSGGPSQGDPYQGDPKDPFESVNRVVWDFNWEVLDQYALRPITIGYVSVMPQFARTGLVNAANNLEEPGNMFNNFFQGKIDEGLDSLARFVINSTVGLLGTIDVAGKIGIEQQRENFGEVLGSWGVETGPYLMVPGLGPNDPRSLGSRFVDNVYYPMAILDGTTNVIRFTVNILEGRAALIDQEPQLEQAIDDYAFVKNAYFQNLEYRVTDGKSGDSVIEEEELDDFSEFESMLDEIDTSDEPK
ncbi:VacJ family lipoprotein [Aestuariibacter sp. A3R04]|nr:VacJ family lipoprotein [Aestuariibacter sp. A3R04]MBU3022088.1 VacJ family lipoprotein [Aestuariibacter sp. A3R04]